MSTGKESIASFEVDHRTMQPGVYVSRKDRVGAEVITTFDLRFCKPNTRSISPQAMHTIEHLGAVYFRNHTDLNVIYFGPMGCLTGFYLVLGGNLEPEDIMADLRHFCLWAVDQTTVPGFSEKECGNWLFHDLSTAKVEIDAFGYILDGVDKGPEIAISKALYDRLCYLGIIDPSGVREANVGQSDYAKGGLIQPWSYIMDHDLDYWDGDIVKRVTRHKDGEPREQDYRKIIHICQEKLRQLKTQE